MIDPKYLKKRGVHSGPYKKIFTLEPAEYPRRIRDLINLISARMKDTYALCLRDHRAFHAIDIAYETPFSQTTPTFINHLLSRHLTAEETLKELEALGLKKEELFLSVALPDGREMLQINPPVFYQIFIPITKAYCTVRLAKIFNERNLSPLLTYNPRINTQRNRVLCELITEFVNTISMWMGYPAVLRQSIQQMLKYGISVAFPREEWYCERQEVENANGTVEKVTMREGIRYTHPHPTRMGFDLRYPLTSLNSNTGCEWALNWHVLSYGDVLDNRDLWNRKKIVSGTNWFDHPLAGNYFKEIYPCAMSYPEIGPTVGKREDRVLYGTGDRDKAVFVTDYFMKLVPSQWGLAEYSHPVWHRFTIAGDDTVMWCAPCAYSPLWFMGYDYDEMTARTSSMALELIPWQDHIGNILSQIILTAKQNLENVTFYDTNMIASTEIEKMKNLGELRYRSRQYLPFDSMKWARQGLNPKDAFAPLDLAKQSIVELLQALPIVLNMMERVLQISAQEAGAAASHQQSKAEVLQTGNAGTNRVAFTCSYVDEGIDAWKAQLYDAGMAYADPNFMAQVSTTIPNVHQILEELGFDFNHRPGEEKLLVHGKKSGLRLEGFAASNQGPERNKSAEVAQIIFQVVGAIAGQPLLVQEIGPKALISLLEQAAIMGGAPKDFKLQTMQQGEGQGGGLTPMITQAIQQAQQATLQAVQEKVGQPAAEAVAEDKQKIAELEAAVKQLMKIYEVAAQTQDKNAIAAREAATKEQIRESEAQAEARRKQEKHALDMQLKSEEAALDMQIKTVESRTDQAIAKEEAATKQAIAAKSPKAD